VVNGGLFRVGLVKLQFPNGGAFESHSALRHLKTSSDVPGASNHLDIHNALPRYTEPESQLQQQPETYDEPSPTYSPPLQEDSSRPEDHEHVGAANYREGPL
jgi:hypothetical protein